MVGIIPARAGFTRSRSTRPVSSTDHPRSRGVYPLAIGRRDCASGSSPLARGLPPHRRRRHLRRRIIPARAGFTRSSRGCGALEADHPRSRGVYGRRKRRSGPGAGSSPLARGLPTAPLSSCPPAWDHPRSRGVYLFALFQMIRVTGSSPLARGLQPRQPRHDRPARIIPARAGFTRRRSPTSTPGWDHPRSRGVYRSRDSVCSAFAGSSPLARGLPHKALP